MYKKHFAAWNFRKYRSRDFTNQGKRIKTKSNTQPHASLQAPGPATLLVPQPRDTPTQNMILSVFHNISRFNEAKLESILTLEAGVPQSSLEFTPLHSFRPIDSVEVYGLFSFSSALYRRDRGHLAGKAIRKAFITVERAMKDLNVHFMWSFVDIMYGMVLRGQVNLLRVFLNYIAALGSRLLPAQHPVAEAFRQLSESSGADKEAIIRQAWRCNYDIIRRWLDPWCELVDDLTWMGSRSLEHGNTESDGNSNFLVVKGLVSHVLDREEASYHDRAKPQEPSDSAADREFRQLRIRYISVMDIVDLLGVARLTRDDLVMDLFSLQTRIPFKAQGLALKGRVYHHLANQQFDEAKVYNDQVRKIAAEYAGTTAYSKLKYLQHLCTVEDKLRMVGSARYAREIGADVLLLAEEFLKDIPDDGA